jgi:hypothetical protein
MACLLAAFALVGCSKNEPVMLGILGYNHTDRYIDTFSVGGQGGSNVFPMEGGGSVVCCIGYRPSRPLPIEMEVEWTFGYRRNEQGEIVVPSETHQKKAILTGPVPDDPHNLEVHFMPDGTVQLRITSMRSPPPRPSVQQGTMKEWVLGQPLAGDRPARGIVVYGR